MEIILAEKNEVIRHAIHHFLSREGHQVTITSNGKEALEELQKKPFDILITNMLLQYYSGFEIISEIKSSGLYPNLKIVVLSDNFTSDNMRRLYQLGIDDMIAKPFSPVEMILRIKKLGELIDKKSP